jgi:hypothetical protein
VETVVVTNVVVVTVVVVVEVVVVAKVEAGKMTVPVTVVPGSVIVTDTRMIITPTPPLSSPTTKPMTAPIAAATTTPAIWLPTLSRAAGAPSLPTGCRRERAQPRGRAREGSATPERGERCQSRPGAFSEFE